MPQMNGHKVMDQQEQVSDAGDAMLASFTEMRKLLHMAFKQGNTGLLPVIQRADEAMDALRKALHENR